MGDKGRSRNNMRTTSSAYADPVNADAIGALANRLYDLAQTVRSGYATRAGQFSTVPAPAWVAKMADDVSAMAKGLPVNDTGIQTAVKAVKSVLSLKGAQDLLDASMAVAEIIGHEDPRVRRITTKAISKGLGVDPDILVQSAQRAASAGDMDSAKAFVREFVTWKARGGPARPHHEHIVEQVRKAVLNGASINPPHVTEPPRSRDTSAHQLLRQATDMLGTIREQAPDLRGGVDAVERLIVRAMGIIR